MGSATDTVVARDANLYDSFEEAASWEGLVPGAQIDRSGPAPSAVGLLPRDPHRHLEAAVKDRGNPNSNRR